MNWRFILSAAKLFGSAAVIVGIITIVIFGQTSQAQQRLLRYRKSGRLADLLKIFSRY
jgi:hypothetical protein